MPTLKMLDLATSHVRSTDRDILNELMSKSRDRNGKPLVLDYAGYGWIVSLGGWSDFFEENAAEAMAAGLSAEFIALLKHGVSEDAQLVRFDADVVPEPEFPEFSWDENDAVVERDVGPRP